nr:hypothetical protein SHINE37_40020 [Rhizobiaceae bacterium]
MRRPARNSSTRYGESRPATPRLLRPQLSEIHACSCSPSVSIKKQRPRSAPPVRQIVSGPLRLWICLRRPRRGECARAVGGSGCNATSVASPGLHQAIQKNKKPHVPLFADPRGFVTLYVRSVFAADNSKTLTEKFVRVNHRRSDGADGHALLHRLLAQEVVGLLFAQVFQADEQRLRPLDEAHGAQVLVELVDPPAKAPLILEMLAGHHQHRLDHPGGCRIMQHAMRRAVVDELQIEGRLAVIHQDERRGRLPRHPGYALGKIVRQQAEDRVVLQGNLRRLRPDVPHGDALPLQFPDQELAVVVTLDDDGDGEFGRQARLPRALLRAGAAFRPLRTDPAIVPVVRPRHVRHLLLPRGTARFCSLHSAILQATAVADEIGIGLHAGL